MSVTLPWAGMHMPWVTYLRRPAHIQRLAAGRGDGHRLAAATAAAIARYRRAVDGLAVRASCGSSGEAASSLLKIQPGIERVQACTR